MLEMKIYLLSIFIALVSGFAIGWFVQFNSSRGLKYELRVAREAEDKSRSNRAEMENAFKAMAADIALANSAAFLKKADDQFKLHKDISEQHLDTKKQLIDKSLAGMNDKLEFIQQQSTALKSSIDTSQKTTHALGESTAQLREILSSSQQRGQWGERMVEDILQVIGLVEDINYTKQRSLESRQRPDFTFKLPKQKILNMDVKFPLAHYEKYIGTEDEYAKTQEKKAFLKDVRLHIKTVCGREYIDPAAGTLDYVMLFIPNESIYGFIHREDAKLIDDALANHVLLCSPLTLYAMLSLIHQAAQNFIMHERASEVMTLIGQFRQQWNKYVEKMDTMGKHIDLVSKNFHDLTTTRTRALEKPLDKIDDLSLIASVVRGEEKE